MPIRSAAWRQLILPFQRQALPDRIEVATAAGPVVVAVRISERARRLTLRCRTADDAFELVAPRRVSAKQAIGFVQAQGDWIAARLGKLEPRLVIAPGAEIPFLGALLRIEPDPARRGPARLEDGRLLVGGAPEFLVRRVRDFLGARARAEIVPQARAFAAALDRPIRRISVRDPKSRWGSCSARGDLAFSWRLVMAPAPVLRYVVAHEAAHLVEMNHSPRFWALVDRLVPDAAASRDWLKAHGTRLMRIG